MRTLPELVEDLEDYTDRSERPEGDYLRGLLQEAADRLCDYAEALVFYADPETYHAVGFRFDPPTGGFDEDFDELHGHEFYDRPMPGATARRVLGMYDDGTTEEK